MDTRIFWKLIFSIGLVFFGGGLVFQPGWDWPVFLGYAMLIIGTHSITKEVANG